MRLDSLSTALTVGFETLRANPLRTLLSTLGVIIGVGSLVAVLSVGDGMESAWRAQIARTSDLQAITLRSETMEQADGQYFAIRDPVVLTRNDAQALSKLPGVRDVLFTLRGMTEVRPKGGDSRRMVLAEANVVTSDAPDSVRLESGRGLSAEELGGSQPIAVISHDLAQQFTDGTTESLVGQTLLVEDTSVMVVGILSPPAASSRPQRRRPPRDYRIRLPLEFARGVMPASQRVMPVIIVRAVSLEETDPVRGRVERWLAERDTSWSRLVSVTTSEGRLAQVTKGILTFKLFMGAVTGISLLVGGIGIMNVLLASVTERTREIGIRKAAGARDRDIHWQFLAESIAISGVGSAIGLVLGASGAIGITSMIRHFADAPFITASLSFSTFLVAALAAVIIGLAFGTYPARRAARLSPIDAIRHE